MGQESSWRGEMGGFTENKKMCSRTNISYRVLVTTHLVNDGTSFVGHANILFKREGKIPECITVRRLNLVLKKFCFILCMNQVKNIFEKHWAGVSRVWGGGSLVSVKDEIWNEFVVHPKDRRSHRRAVQGMLWSALCFGKIPLMKRLKKCQDMARVAIVLRHKRWRWSGVKE